MASAPNWRECGDGLERECRIRMGDDGARLIHQEGKAARRGPDGAHGAHHGGKQHVGADHGDGLPAGPTGSAKVTPTSWRDKQIGRRHDGPAFLERLPEPGAGRHVVVGSHLVEEEHALVGVAEVGIREAAAVAQRLDHGTRVRRIDGLGQRMRQQALGRHPFAQHLGLGVHELAALVVEGGQHMALHREEVGNGQGQHGHGDDGHAERDESRTQDWNIEELLIARRCYIR